MTASSVLVADDDESLRRVIEFNLQEDGYEVEMVATGTDAIERIGKRNYDVIITDIQMPDVDGMAVLDAARRMSPQSPVILITAYASVETAVAAIRRGAYDYVTKPFRRDELKLHVARALRSSKLEGENRRLQGELEDRLRPESLILGSSAVMQNLLERIRMVGATDAAVLITGESGTGKELVARALHFSGARRAGPFVVVNCGAIPRDLLESELFGHVRGAFTSAVKDKIGKFEQASGGTLFLDEIGDLPKELQVKLLRALQEHEVERVGEGKPRRIDVRTVAATNLDLDAMIAKGLFREDLYYRINVIPIDVPPLRERREDIPLLIRHFLGRFAPNAGLEISQEALDQLCQARWRGNVRELMNVCERLVALRRSTIIQASDLPLLVKGEPRASAPLVNLPPEGASLDEMIVDTVVLALERCHWNQTRAARLLRIPRHILLYRMEKYHIVAPKRPEED